MPRGVKGSGKPAKRRPRIEDEDEGVPKRSDPDKPTCRVDGTPLLEAGGQCPSCARRAQRFKDLFAREAEASRCEICTAPGAYRRGGKRHCALCRKLLKREEALKTVARR